MVRTRFAPSPSGYLHIGNLRTALFAYLIAKHNNGEFILRIEDTNQDKYSADAENFIYAVMDKFNLKYDEGPKIGGEYGPYIQSERINIYKKYVKYLVDNNLAYPCFCDDKEIIEKKIKAQQEGKYYTYDGTCRNLTKEQVQEHIANGEKYCIRQKLNKDGTTSFHDEVYGDITLDNKDLDDQVLLKSDGYPTYNLANVVDDGLMNITHVTRGSEYISSTSKYIQLYDAFNFDLPKFVHLPHVIKEDGSDFSKSKKDENVNYLLELGYLPEAIINYIALLGWSPEGNQEFFTLDELVDIFDIERISKDNAHFDIKKLRWYNKHYIGKMNDDEYIRYASSFLIKYVNIQGKSRDFINGICNLYKDHISYGYEIVELSKTFFIDYAIYDSASIQYLKKIPNTKEIVLTFKEEIAKITNWDVQSITSLLENIKSKYNIDIYMIIRIAITGSMIGINLVDTIMLLGKEKILSRLG